MLEPTTRALFVDAFRPPTGHHVDLAVGTTYTLNLRTLLLPPLAMAAHDREIELTDTAPETEHAPADTLALLEAVRRYADRTTVYCHAGAIGSPGTYARLLAFTEDCVVQTRPAVPGHIFHPKVWALRFRKDTSVIHRLVVCSRNLTDDSSWDTLVILEEGEHDKGISGAPGAEFLEALPGLAHGHLAPSRPQQTRDLAATMRDAWFEVPKPFTGGSLHPLGHTPASTDRWPMPPQPDRAVVISPFLDVPTVAKVTARARPVLVSREETFELVGANALGQVRTTVLNPHAEAELASPPAPASRPGEVRTGLHAKVLVWDEGPVGHVYVGSANATHAAFHGNVEFNVALTGPRKTCGVEALMPDEATRDRVTFGSVIQDHTVRQLEPGTDPDFEAERAAILHHERLLEARPRLTCEPLADGTYAVTLTFAKPVPPSPGMTQVRLVSRPRTDRLPPATAQWESVHLTQLTAYLEVVTHVPSPSQDDDLEVASVLRVELLGAPEGRTAAILRGYLGSEDSIVRYLRFLLDEAGGGSMWDELTAPEVDGSSRRRTTATFEDLAILEPLLRAAAEGSEALDRVEALLRDLGVTRDEQGVVPSEFLDMWHAVWEASRGGER